MKLLMARQKGKELIIVQSARVGLTKQGPDTASAKSRFKWQYAAFPALACALVTIAIFSLPKLPDRVFEPETTVGAIDYTEQVPDSLVVEKSFGENATVYSTLAQLVADADYVFRGILSSLEPVQGASWQWEIYEVRTLYKGIDTAKYIRIIAESSLAINTAKHEIGSEYYVFATVYELPVYPYPLINPIYGQTVFQVMDNGQLSLSGITDKEMIPAVFDEYFTQNAEEAITKSPELLQARSMTHVVDRYSSLAEMLADSDLVVRVVFSEAEKVNQYVTIGQIKEIIADYKVDRRIPLPISIAVNEDIRPGDEYIIFMKCDSLGESFQLASREGAIINQADNESQWNEVLEILSQTK